MIHVIVGHAVAGRFNYRILTPETRLAAPMGGISATPLLDACRMLKRMGAASDDTEIGLFSNEWEGDAQSRLHTTVGSGATQSVKDNDEGTRFRGYRPLPDAISSRRGAAKEALKSPEATEIAPQPEKRIPEPRATQETAIGERSAKSEAAPPPPHKRQASPAGKDRAHSKPAKPKSSPHKRKLTKSGGRRGQR